MKALAWAWPALLLAAHRAPSQLPSIRMKLVRCAPEVDVSCLQLGIRLSPDEARRAADLDPGTEPTSWSGDLAGIRLVGPGEATSPVIEPPVHLHLLIDRSSAMSGAPTAFTRDALHQLLEQLNGSAVRVTIGTIDAHGGSSTALLSVPDAIAALDSLPLPDRRPERALYSALASTAAIVAREGTSTSEIILVVVAGGDLARRTRADTSLLSGTAGLQAATAALRAARAQLWSVVLGDSTEPGEFAILAAGSSTTSAAPVNPNAIRRQISVLAASLRRERTLTFGVSGEGATGLAGALWRGTIRLAHGGTTIASREVIWRPPLFALPAYQGVALAGALPGELRDALASGSTGGSARWEIAAALTLVLLLAWRFVPHWLWLRGEVRLEMASRRVVPTPSRRAAALGLTPTAFIRTQEAPPRNPGEITRQTGRRTALDR